MGFFFVKQGYFSAPRPTVRQPWYQRMFCFIIGHDWVQKEKAPTGYVVFNPAFMPVNELKALHICNRCLKDKWVSGYVPPPLMMGEYFRFYKCEEAWPHWPLDDSGNRLPMSKRPNRSGW